MPKCIFCLRENVPFNQEHVIPQGFGKFGSNNPTFSKDDGIVCEECNQKFGDKIDRVLLRETAEGLKRLEKLGRQHDLRLDYVRNIRFYVKFGDRSPIDAYIDPLDYIQRNEIRFISQLRLIQKSGAPFYVFDKHSIEALSLKDYRPNKWQILSNDRVEADEWEQILISKGFDAPKITKIDEPFTKRKLTEVFAHAVIGEEVFRAVAKIGFEFFIYSVKKDKLLQQFDVYSDHFKEIREFIAGENKRANWAEVFELGKPMLAQESERVTVVTEGIVVTASVEKGKVIAGVRIYELFSYHVVLAGEVDPKLTYRTGMFFKPGQEAEPLYARKSNLLIAVADIDANGRPFYRGI